MTSCKPYLNDSKVNADCRSTKRRPIECPLRMSNICQSLGQIKELARPGKVSPVAKWLNGVAGRCDVCPIINRRRRPETVAIYLCIYSTTFQVTPSDFCSKRFSLKGQLQFNWHLTKRGSHSIALTLSLTITAFTVTLVAFQLFSLIQTEKLVQSKQRPTVCLTITGWLTLVQWVNWDCVWRPSSGKWQRQPLRMSKGPLIWNGKDDMRR